jgi:hypothetical protein
MGVPNLSGRKSAFTKACPNLYMLAESSDQNVDIQAVEEDNNLRKACVQGTLKGS